ncbi:MAG: M48 family metalloprotease [Nitrosotalea sp.]
MVKAIEYLEKLQKEGYSKYNLKPEQWTEILKKPNAKTIEKVVSKQKGFLDDDKISQMKEQLIQHYDELAKTKLPTIYETHLNYHIISRLSTEIESAIPTITCVDSETGEKKSLKVLNPNFTRPIFGTLPMGQINATSYGGFENNEYLITFEWELFQFCNLLSKIVAYAMPFRRESDGIIFLTDEKTVQQRIQNEPMLTKRFRELIVAYLTKGRVTAAPQYNIDSPYDKFTAILRHSMELFIMGHEYAHILLGHLENQDTKKKHLTPQDVYNILFSWDQELEADSLGLPLMLSAMTSEKTHNHLALHYCGAELFFSGYEILERSKCIAKQGNDDWYWRGGKEDGPIGEHPPSERRRDNLRKMMIRNYGEDSVKTSILAEHIVKNLWEQTKPRLIRAYEKWVKINSNEHLT